MRLPRLQLQPAATVPGAGPWEPAFGSLVTVGASVLGMVAATAFLLFVPTGPFGRQEYHLWRWQAETLVHTAFARLDIGDDPDAGRAEASVRQYFELTTRLRGAEDAPAPDLALIAALENERATYENDVERAIERYITEVVGDAGLTTPLPLFSAVRIVWPPVDFELTSPPRLLVRSPRSRIEREGDTLLKNDLTLAQVERIEERVTDDDTSAIVISIGGLAAYPAIVRDDRSLGSVVETAAHEWVHHYLAFHALGARWGEGGDAEALNETTANIAGEAIAAEIGRRYRLELPPGADGRAPAAAQPPVAIDFNVEMRSLRLAVDGLLAGGKIAEAEALMEERRVWLGEHGIAIRKLNQAYFAFYGTYADLPQSSNPIGEKTRRVWELTGDVGAFLAVMRDVESADELDAALAALER